MRYIALCVGLFVALQPQDTIAAGPYEDCKSEADCPLYYACSPTANQPERNVCHLEERRCSGHSYCPEGFRCEEQITCLPIAGGPDTSCLSNGFFCQMKEIPCTAPRDCPKDWICPAPVAPQPMDCGPGIDDACFTSSVAPICWPAGWIDGTARPKPPNSGASCSASSTGSLLSALLLLGLALGVLASRRRGLRISCSLLACIPILGGACQDCDRDGCDAMNDKAHRQLKQGIGGAVGSQSDTNSTVMGQSCTECPLSESTVGIWRTNAPIDDDVTAQSTCDEEAPYASIPADPHYGAELDTGSYLVCVGQFGGACVSVSVESAKVTTVNVLLPFGEPKFYVSPPDGRPVKAVQRLFASCLIPPPNPQQAPECPDELPFRAADGQSCVECFTHLDCQTSLHCDKASQRCLVGSN